MEMRLYCDANPKTVAYCLDGGGSGYQNLSPGYSSMEAEYLAIIYGLNEYFIKWQKELDSKFSDLNPDTKEFIDRVGSPADRTARPLPPPVLVLSDNETVIRQLQREYHIGNDRLRKLAMQVWKVCENLQVRFQWIPRAENIAGKMLK